MKIRLHSDNPLNSHLVANTHVIDDTTPFGELTINGSGPGSRVVSLFLTTQLVAILYRFLTDKKHGGNPDDTTTKLSFVRPTVQRISTETGLVKTDLIAFINNVKPRKTDTEHAAKYFAKTFVVKN